MIARGVMLATLPEALVTVVLSDFANVALILMAAESARDTRAIKSGTAEIVRALPEANEAAMSDIAADLRPPA